jgi:hypothetical protein
MRNDAPYAYNKFIGVKPFTKLLDESGVRYLLFDDESIPRLFRERPEHLKAGEDTIAVGKCVQDNMDVYFAEFGIKITASFRSYIVFIYDHHPVADELLATVDDMEPLIQKSLEGVNLEDLRKSGE